MQYLQSGVFIVLFGHFMVTSGIFVNNTDVGDISKISGFVSSGKNLKLHCLKIRVLLSGSKAKIQVEGFIFRKGNEMSQVIYLLKSQAYKVS
jgi:hypothetical protein